jgi:hypothetical protein
MYIKPKSSGRETKKRYCILRMGIIYQEDITTININVSNVSAPNFIKNTTCHTTCHKRKDRP